MYRLVVEAATGRRELSEDDLARIVEHVAEAGFDPDQRILAGGRPGGLFLEGGVITETDRLSSLDFHYLLHVRSGREWPVGTTKEGYEESLRAVITDPGSGILTSWYRRGTGPPGEARARGCNVVEKTGIASERIDLELSEIAAEARFLPKLEKLWPGEPPANRFVYDEEWHNLMGALKYLESAYREGAMTPEQEGRYRDLKALLEESVPILKRLGFTLPPVPLDV